MEMTKGWAVLPWESRCNGDDKGESGPSVGESLLNGDDKGEGGPSIEESLLNGDDKGMGGPAMEESLLNGDDKGKGGASMGEQLPDESRFIRCAARSVRNKLRGEAYPALVVGIEPAYCVFK
jgi:hypothetical protein